MAETETPLERAIRLADGMTSLARKLQERGKKITGHATIYQWKQSRVPADFCPDIEALTGVKCEELRPDVNWAVLRKSAEEWTGAERRRKQARA
jgi:hypothetical protein